MDNPRARCCASLRSLADTFDGVADDCTDIADVSEQRGKAAGLRFVADAVAHNECFAEGVIDGLKMAAVVLRDSMKDPDAELDAAHGFTDTGPHDAQ